MECKSCGKKIEGYCLKYDGYSFCRRNNDECLKDYLFDKYDDDIQMEIVESDEEYEFHEKCKKGDIV